jgi:hypothetical protein
MTNCVCPALYFSGVVSILKGGGALKVQIKKRRTYVVITLNLTSAIFDKIYSFVILTCTENVGKTAKIRNIVDVFPAETFTWPRTSIRLRI